MLLQFEESIEGSLAARVYSYLTGRPIDDFRDKAIEDLPPEVLEDLEKLGPLIGRMKMASFVDRKGKLEGDPIQAVLTLIDQEVSGNEHFKPDVVLIDWLGAAVSDFIQQSDKALSYPLAAEAIQDKLNAYGKQKKVTFVYLHQTDTVTQERESGYKPTKNNAYQFHAFANKLEVCLQIGTTTLLEDKRRVCWLVVGKARHAVPGLAQIIILNGRMMRMEATEEGEYVIGPGGMLKPVHALINMDQDPEESYGYEKGSIDEFTNSYK